MPLEEANSIETNLQTRNYKLQGLKTVSIYKWNIWCHFGFCHNIRNGFSFFWSRLSLTFLCIKVKAHNTMKVIRKSQLPLLTGILIGILSFNTSRIQKKIFTNKKSLYLSAYKMTSEYFKNFYWKSGQKSSWLFARLYI